MCCNVCKAINLGKISAVFFVWQEVLGSAATKYNAATGKTVDMTIDKTSYLSPDM